MLSQRFNENMGSYHLRQYNDSNSTSKQSMLYKAIQILKSEKIAAIQAKQNACKQNQQQKNQLRRQIEYQKKKITQLTQINLLHNLVTSNNGSNIYNHKAGSLIPANCTTKADDHVQLKLQLDHCKSIIKQKNKEISKIQKINSQLQEHNRTVLKEKQKNMEISLIQKIAHEQRIQILDQEVLSKKRIIEGLKSEINRISGIEKDVLVQQQNIVKRGRQIKHYEQQFQSYYAQNQKRYKNKIQVLESENSFLKKQFKKVVKQVKKSCKCEGQAQQWKEKLYRLGKELAQARVELERNGITKHNKLKNNKSPKLQSSIESLVLSDDSSSDDKQN